MLKKLFLSISLLTVAILCNAGGFQLIPDSAVDANANAQALVGLINAGKKITLEGNTYYIGAAKERIHKNIYIKGPGTIITTTGNNLYVDSSISIKLIGVTLKTTLDITVGVQNRFIVNEGINYHRKLVVKQCNITGVRVFTHVASDVDQVTTLDGVKNVLFANNSVSNIGDYIMLLTNCKSDKVRIENNTISRLYVMGFGLGADNSYKNLGFARMKKVYFKNNHIDNTGLVIKDADNFGSTYMTPILCEADYCLCEGNDIRNILATKHKSIALYPFYLSCREVIIKDNYIEDCIHLTDSHYNEMFKCKGGPGGSKDRRIEGNRYVITQKCLALAPKGTDMPCIGFTGFQFPEMGKVVIRGNKVDLACDFVFGAGARCSYKSFLFENNVIAYNDAGSTAQQLLRLKPAPVSGCDIIVRNNVMRPEKPASDVYGLFLGDCTGYNFTITNNLLSGCLPTGEDDIDPSSPLTFKSSGNRVDLGKSHSVVRISRNVSCDDTFTRGENYTMYIYPSDIMQGSLKFHFAGTSPANVMTFTRLPNAGGCDVTVSDQSEVKKYSCGVVGSQLFIMEHGKGDAKLLTKGNKVAKQYVGSVRGNIGRMISDGEMIYYSTSAAAQGKDITLELKYSKQTELPINE